MSHHDVLYRPKIYNVDGMRLLRLTTNYPVYLEQFEAKHPELAEADYATRYATHVADAYAWADVWTNALTPLGYEVWEPIGNARAMQECWAEEHGIEVHPDNWMYDIVTAQLKWFKPDILFVDDYGAYTASFLKILRSEVPSIRLIFGWCAAPFHDETVFREYDVVLSSMPTLVKEFRDAGHDARHIRHAFDPRVLDKLASSTNDTIPLSFIGSLFKGSSFHNERSDLIVRLARAVDIAVFSDAPSEELTIIPSQTPRLLARLFGAKAKPGKTIRIRPPQFGLDMYRAMRESSVSLNNHIGFHSGSASNMRLYEATGVGACLLTDAKPDLHEMFEPHVEVATYTSPEECIEKALWLAGNPAARRALATAGQKRTLRDHTFAHRAALIDEIVRDRLS